MNVKSKCQFLVGTYRTAHLYSSYTILVYVLLSYGIFHFMGIINLNSNLLIIAYVHL